VGTDRGRTRERLLRVAREVLAEEGLPGATIREIAGRADVNPALLHYYFGSKSGLHAAVVEEAGKQIRANVESLKGQGGSARERLRNLLRGYVLTLGDEPYLAQVIVQQLLLADGEQDQDFVSQVGKPLIEGLVELLEEGIATGEFREFDPAFLVSSIAANCLGLFLAGPLFERSGRMGPSSPTQVEAWAQSVADLILSGLAR
jgi:AcrR family transcriptional regulator